MTFLAIHGCEIDLAASRIKGANGWIQLKPKSMEVLEYLLQHPRDVCTREEILNAVWGRSIVSDDVLSQAIRVFCTFLLNGLFTPFKHPRRPPQIVPRSRQGLYQHLLNQLEITPIKVILFMFSTFLLK